MASFAYMVGSLVDQLVVANTISTPILIIFTIFGGLYINERSLPPGGEWVKFLSPIRYVWYGIAYNEFEG